MMRKLPITLQEILTGTCPYRGCVNNTDGECFCDEEDFTYELKAEIPPELNDCPLAEVDHDRCEMCGGLLREGRWLVGHHGSAPAYAAELTCTLCGESRSFTQ